MEITDEQDTVALPSITEFVSKVEDMVDQEDIKYSIAVCKIAEEYELEPEDIAKLLPAPLLAKIKVEAEQHRNITKTSQTATLI